MYQNINIYFSLYNIDGLQIHVVQQAKKKEAINAKARNKQNEKQYGEFFKHQNLE